MVNTDCSNPDALDSMRSKPYLSAEGFYIKLITISIAENKDETKSIQVGLIQYGH